MFYHIVREPIRKDFAREGRDRDARALSLQDIAKVFKVAVSAADRAVLEFKSRNVGPGYDFVGRVEVFGCSMCLRIDHLRYNLSERDRKLEETQTSISRKFSGWP